MSPDPRAARPDLPDLPPPPPASGGALAWLRWTITVVRAGRGRDRLAIRRHHAPTGGTESLGTVAIALGADLAMVVAKAVAALLTGSAALFAETLHSLADSGNQLLLLKGLRGSRRRPDASHPFGYGADLFYWSLLAALGVFVVGGVLSVWEGVQHLLHPGEVQVTLLGVAVLGLGCLLDGTSWLSSVRQLRREAAVRGVRFRRHLGSTTDTAVTAVFYEDAAALVGNMIALAGLGLHQLLGSPAPDAVAGIAIGLLLAAIGLRLAARNRALDRAGGPDLRPAAVSAPGRAPGARGRGDPPGRPGLPDTGPGGGPAPGADAVGRRLLAAAVPGPRAGMIANVPARPRRPVARVGPGGPGGRPPPGAGPGAGRRGGRP
jgi:cation diffusion facilitator family transporter